MYIFGYGSLLNSASRQLTGQTGAAIPVIIRGLVRFWNVIDHSYTLAPLAVKVGDGQVNGVLLEVDETELSKFDCRESGYQRIQVAIEQIESEAHFDRSKIVWVYVSNSETPPNSDSPIVQSYIDTVIAGCLEISEQFARLFVEHTHGWHHAYENDRHQPRYTRTAIKYDSTIPTIDRIIAEVNCLSA